MDLSEPKNNGDKTDLRLTFYEQTVRQLISNLDASILVVAGGKNDRDVFHRLGFTNVTISNLDTRMNDNEFYPYRWCHQDAQGLTYRNEEFDYVVEHAGLHHCGSPHRALLEMYRVSRIGLLALEGRDSVTMTLLKKLNLTPDYEWAGVFYWEKGEFGGVNNTIVPNYIYRWTEAEVEKAINSFAPHARHSFAGAGHGIVVIEEAVIVEVKNGPYIPEADKGRFEGNKEDKLKSHDTR